MPKVSVIMGIYNCKNLELLDKSINSILNQTLKDIEFIICDDGSTNGVLSFLKKKEKEDSRIKILSYPHNIGLHNALNTCLKESNSDYIARQDDDDISFVNRLEKEYNFLISNPEYSIVGTLADVVDEFGSWGNYKVPEIPQKTDFYWNSPFIHPTIMVRKDAYEKVNGYRIAKETRRCEDIDLFMRMYAIGLKGYNIQEILYSYRMINDFSKKYRPMKYRIDEAIVKFKGYKSMNILFRGFPFILKPIIIGLIPQKILYYIKKKVYMK